MTEKSKLIKSHDEAGIWARRLIAFHTKRDTINGRPGMSRIFGKWAEPLSLCVAGEEVMRPPVYIVCSYRESWPMYVYDSCSKQWYGNSEKYSRSTTMHMNHAQPVPYDQIEWMGLDQIQALSVIGAVEMVRRKLAAAYRD